MEFWDWVLVGVVVAGIVGTWRWLWMRRRRPLDWVAAGKAAVERRRRRIAAARHEELVEWVLDRAKTLNKDVPVAVERRTEFDVVTVHPSGRQLFYVRNHEAYARLLGSGLPYRRTFPQKWTGQPVSEWSDDELRGWLRQRIDELPPDGPG